ncbi:universal stress protein [Caballeronia catudaia]|uniref:Universal stress protein n=1 Tax=Caballeronia catudaia TaxID=1777136 RepID=A0A158B1L8_9BURK|nr:universal stress protein [Caballeronia catudaia]SAK63972.1 universal stress protein [Caballeronia catudaia]
MYRHILVALDGSESSQRALEEVLCLGASPGTRVRLVHVLEASALASYPVNYRSQVRDAARRVLDAAQERLRAAGIECESELDETRTPDDSIADALQRSAQRMDADLVVMGTRGRGGLPRLVLGSVAEAFLRHSTCAVLLTRSASQRGAST